MSLQDFSFGFQAPTFNDHIRRSIPGYDDLLAQCRVLSRRFVRTASKVIDIGCSTGHFIADIAEHNVSRSNVAYIGIDIETRFMESWKRLDCPNLRFLIDDVRQYSGYDGSSLVSSFFTLQFLREDDRVPLLKKINDGLIEGGALIVAEKILANTSRLQDALTFPYYDFKIGNGFTAEEVLSKERMLRGQMTLWKQEELQLALQSAGFTELQIIWSSFPFIAYIAIKQSVAQQIDLYRVNRRSDRSMLRLFK